MKMLEKVKMALRITTSAFDDQLNDLISAGCRDLEIAGVDEIEQSDPLIIRAVTTYCACNFGKPSNYKDLKASYDEQKSQLRMATGYVRWKDE